jgi:hypothetical protein
MHYHRFPPDSLEHGSGRTLDASATGQAHWADDTRAHGTVYGYEVRADFALPRLRKDVPQRRGTLNLRSGAVPPGPAIEIARDPGERGPAWILARTSTGLVVRFANLGQMLLDVSAGTILCQAELRADPAEWENRVLCSGITQLLAARGDLVAHAAAVVHEGAAVLFCGSPAAGKSTIVLELASLGFELLSEDAAVISGLPARALAWPGPAGVRVRGRSGSKALRTGPEIRLHRGPAPVAAVFVIGSHSPRGLAIEPLSPARLAAAVARQAAFAGVRGRRGVLRLAGGLAACVPGFLLRAPHGLRAFTEAAGDLAAHIVEIRQRSLSVPSRPAAFPGAGG